MSDQTAMPTPNVPALPGAAAIRLRGHGPKIAQAVSALRAAGKLPPALRPVELTERINAWLRAAGYAEAELPSRFAIARYFKVSSA